MRPKTKLLNGVECQLRDNDEFPEFEGGGDDLLTEGRRVVLVGVPHFFHKATTGGLSLTLPNPPQQR